MGVIGSMESKVLMLEWVCMYILYICKHESRTWTPSLENWGRWVKDLFWLANSPHTSNVTDSRVKSTNCIVVTLTHLGLSGGLANYGSYYNVVGYL